MNDRAPDTPTAPDGSQGSRAAESPAGDGHDHDQVGHVVPASLLVNVLVCLLFLTFVTVAVAQVDLDFLNVWIAMGVATVKASLVCAFFMHLRWDKPFNSIVFVGTVVFLGLFIILSGMDQTEYKPDLRKDFSIENDSVIQYRDVPPPAFEPEPKGH